MHVETCPAPSVTRKQTGTTASHTASPKGTAGRGSCVTRAQVGTAPWGKRPAVSLAAGRPCALEPAGAQGCRPWRTCKQRKRPGAPGRAEEAAATGGRPLSSGGDCGPSTTRSAWLARLRPEAATPGTRIRSPRTGWKTEGGRLQGPGRGQGALCSDRQRSSP